MSDLDTLVDRVIRETRGRDRLIVAVAGPPGAGKSTVTKQLVDRLNDGTAGVPAAAFPMDGFHLSNRVLAERGWLSRKGAPQTFDTDGFARTLNRIRGNDGDVPIPLFDRTLDAAIENAAVIRRHHRLIVVEGNYLLLDREPWRGLLPRYDLTVFLRVDAVILENRLIRRWLDQGLDNTAASARALSNDLPNARLVVENSVAADLTFDFAD